MDENDDQDKDRDVSDNDYDAYNKDKIGTKMIIRTKTEKTKRGLGGD